jgi:hypothetical protein
MSKPRWELVIENKDGSFINLFKDKRSFYSEFDAKDAFEEFSSLHNVDICIRMIEPPQPKEQSEIDRLKSERDEYRKALEFYADPLIYQNNAEGVSPISLDVDFASNSNGRTARNVLKKWEGKE